MRVLKETALAAAVCACAGLFALPASAKAPSLSECVHSAREVREAIANNQSAAKLEDARRQQRYGLEFCNNGLFEKGVAHYAEALKILGADKSAGGGA